MQHADAEIESIKYRVPGQENSQQDEPNCVQVDHFHFLDSSAAFQTGQHFEIKTLEQEFFKSSLRWLLYANVVALVFFSTTERLGPCWILLFKTTTHTTKSKA